MDVICTDDLDQFGRDLNDPLAELLQDITHALLEGYASNISDLDRSVGLFDALSGPVDPTLSHAIETKLGEDPRIAAVQVVSITATATNTIALVINVQVDETYMQITLTFDSAGNVQTESILS